MLFTCWQFSVLCPYSPSAWLADCILPWDVLFAQLWSCVSTAPCCCSQVHPMMCSCWALCSWAWSSFPQRLRLGFKIGSSKGRWWVKGCYLFNMQRFINMTYSNIHTTYDPKRNTTTPTWLNKRAFIKTTKHHTHGFMNPSSAQLPGPQWTKPCEDFLNEAWPWPGVSLMGLCVHSELSDTYLSPFCIKALWFFWTFSLDPIVFFGFDKEPCLGSLLSMGLTPRGSRIRVLEHLIVLSMLQQSTVVLYSTQTTCRKSSKLI